jgi:hypothetical protein
MFSRLVSCLFMVASEPVASCAAHMYLRIDQMSMGFMGIYEKYLKNICVADCCKLNALRTLHGTAAEGRSA